MYRMNPNEELTANKVIRYIEHNRMEAARRQKLYDYYLGKADILNKSYTDASKPCSKIVNPYAAYITNIATAYFIGAPVEYRSSNEEFVETYNNICKYNDEAHENMTVAKNASICGESYELLWIDTDGNIRFKALPPVNCIPIYDNTLEEELIYFIRYYEDVDIETNSSVTYVDVYTKEDIRHYKYDTSVMLIGAEPHIFGAVPVIVYRNNEEIQGDAEKVLSLIDAYNTVISNEIDDLSAFTDAILCINGALGTTDEDITTMKENRVMLLDNNSSANWLTKNVNDNHENNIKKVINENIYTFSGVPNMSDESFAANASGVAIKYKTLALSNMTRHKEACYKKGLQRRIELITLYLAVLGTNYDWRDIEIIFSRDLPTNLAEQADIITKIGHLLSTETQLNLLPIGVDTKAEIERKRAEDAEGYSDIFGGENV